MRGQNYAETVSEQVTMRNIANLVLVGVTMGATIP